MKRAIPLLLIALGASLAPAMADPVAAGSARGGSVFKCDGGRELNFVFANYKEQPAAIIDAGQGAFALPLQPWIPGEAKITWSDGERTLTWTAGVRLMLMDGASHLSCGRGGHQH